MFVVTSEIKVGDTVKVIEVESANITDRVFLKSQSSFIVTAMNNSGSIIYLKGHPSGFYKWRFEKISVSNLEKEINDIQTMGYRN